MVIGIISEEIEKETNGEIKSGDICINDYHLNLHIPDMHGNELSQMGVKPLEYVLKIVDSFYEIRDGSRNSYLLVAEHNSENLNNVAAINMEYTCNESNEYYWEVCTAQPRSRKRIEKRRLVWSKNKTVDC